MRLELANELLRLTREVVSREELTFTAPIRTVSEANCRDHWRRRAARAKAQRQAVRWFWVVASGKGLLVRVPLPCVVTLTRLAPRELDDDNLRSAFKAVRDQVADELGLPSDRVPLVTWCYAQERSKTHAVRIRICHDPKQSRIPGVL